MCTLEAADKGTTGGTVKQKPGMGLEPIDCPPVGGEGGDLEQTPQEGRAPRGCLGDAFSAEESQGRSPEPGMC